MKLMKINKSFDSKLINNFCKLSGDYNPIHTNSNYSSKKIIHGIAIVLSALENLDHRYNAISSIDVKFLNFLNINEKIIFKYKKKNNNLIIEGSSLNLDIINIKLSFFEKNNFLDRKNFFTNGIPPKSKVLEFKNSDKKKLHSLPLFLSNSKLKLIYPKFNKSFNSNIISALLCLTRIVGMKIPGLYSIFSGFKLNFSKDFIADNKLNYQIADFDKRWNLIKIKLFNKFTNGEILAFERPKPVIQPSYKTIKSKIKKLNFKNKKILVIGGSSGIGEIFVKILSFYGADLTFTYLKNIENSKRIKKECKNKKINYFKLDINHTYLKKLSSVIKKEKFDQIYYFATPKIFNKESININVSVFDEFYKFYVFEILKILNLVDNITPKKITFLLASTVASTENFNNLKEYILIKSFSEKIFKLNIFSNIKTKIYNFKRVKTDQTSSIHHTVKFNDIVVEAKNAINLMK